MIAFYNEIDDYCCAWLSNLTPALTLAENNAFGLAGGGTSGREPKPFQAISYLRRTFAVLAVHTLVCARFPSLATRRKLHNYEAPTGSAYKNVDSVNRAEVSLLSWLGIAPRLVGVEDESLEQTAHSGHAGIRPNKAICWTGLSLSGKAPHIAYKRARPARHPHAFFDTKLYNDSNNTFGISETGEKTDRTPRIFEIPFIVFTNRKMSGIILS